MRFLATLEMTTWGIREYMNVKSALATIALAILAACAAPTAPAPSASAPTQIAPPIKTLAATPSSPPSKTLPLPPADEAASRISVPAGFAIRIFAQELRNPRLMAFGPDGMLYVTLTGAGEIARLPDKNNRGVADGIEIIARNLSEPHGIEWHDGWMYVAESGRVERFDQAFAKRELVTDNIPSGGTHFTRTLHFGPDGKLYVSGGSSCNVCVESDPRRAAILRFNLDGSIPSDNPFASDPDTRKRTVWAYGLRNSVDFLWTPNGQLWADMNGVDGLGDDKPPEIMVALVERGKSYGWPYCYNPTLGAIKSTALARDTRLALPSGFDCTMAVPALFTDLAHSAPLGMSFARGGSFPAAMQNDLFVVYHGSWNSNVPRDCKVERIVIENGVPVRSEDFANGWRAAGRQCGDSATWGRPADVIFGPDGAMYISDDAGGRVYRVAYVGQSNP